MTLGALRELRVEALRGAAHAAAFATLHAGAFARPWGRGEFSALLDQPTTRAHGLFLGAEITGFAVSQLVTDEAELLTVTVASQWRGRGHAGPLLARHLEDLAVEGAQMVHLEVENGNAPALALYARAGFREVGRRPGYYARAREAPAEAIRMSVAPAGAARAVAGSGDRPDGARGQAA